MRAFSNGLVTRARGLAGRSLRTVKRVLDERRSGGSVALVFVTPDELRAGITDRAGLLAPGSAGPLIWPTAGAERHVLHDGLLRRLASAGEHPRLLSERFLSPGEYYTDPAYFVRFRQALLWPRWGLVMLEPGRLWDDSTVAPRWFTPTLMGVPGIFTRHGASRLSLGVARPARVIEGPALLLNNSAHHVYGHWLMDCLPGVVAFLEPLLAGKLSLVAPALSPWQRRTLQRLRIPPTVITEITDTVVECRDLIFASFLSSRGIGRPSQMAAQALRVLADSPPGQNRAGAPPLIYVSRADVPRGRVMSNERRLIEALARIGFVDVMPGALTIDQQIDFFSAARVIVGPLGSGLANVGFAPPGCVVIEILPSSYLDTWIFHLTALRGQRYAPIIANVRESDAREIEMGGTRHRDVSFTYEVDVDIVVQAAGVAASLET